jgi:exopolysaccharide production protein ExoZ
VGRWQERLRRFFELEGTSDRLRSMEGLRGIAVALVFFVHYEALFGGWVAPGTASARAASFLATVGHTGVDLFFVLSGYLIYGAILKMRESQGGYAAFMRRRVRRIYPTFLVMLGVYLALSMVVPSESKLPAGLGPAVVYLIENALLLPILFGVTPLITVSWSLGYEVFFYAILPLLVGVFGMRRWQRRSRVLAFGALAAGYVVACFLGATHVQFILFVSGILLYEACNSERVVRLLSQARVQWIGAAALAAFLPVAFLVVTGRVPGLPASVAGRHIACAVWLFFVLFVVTLVAFRAPGPLRELFSVAPLRWLGNMSYSYYLMHSLALKGLALAIARLRPGWSPGATGHWLFLPLAFAATLVSSAVLFAAVERRFSLAPRRSRSAARPPALTLDAASAH